MNKIYFSIAVVSGAFLVFTVLVVSTPISVLLLFLLALQAGLVWMVLTILKNGEPSTFTFDERFYEDKDLGPHGEVADHKER